MKGDWIIKIINGALKNARKHKIRSTSGHYTVVTGKIMEGDLTDQWDFDEERRNQ